MTAKKTPKPITAGAPFTSETGREARAIAAQHRVTQAEDNRAAFEARMLLAQKITERLPRKGSAEVFFATARKVATDVLIGKVPIRNGSDAAAVVKAMMDVGRLELGEATSRTENVSRDEQLARVQSLQDQLAERRKNLERPATG